MGLITLFFVADGVGRGGRTPPVTEKNANMDVRVFFYLADRDHGERDVPPPLRR